MSFVEEFLIKTGEVDIAAMDGNTFISLLISASSLVVAFFSFAIALIVLFYAAYQHFSKRGVEFHGLFQVSSSAWSNQPYVSEVVIENFKDKAVAVSTIYLRVDSNIYLELVDYTHSPRVLSPFETIKLSFHEGVSGYIASTYKASIGKMLLDHKIPKSLVVATPSGLSVVRKYKTYWNVYFESLRNNFIIPVRPVKKIHNGQYYADTLKFIVMEKTSVGEEKEHRLYSGGNYTIGGVTVSADDIEGASQLERILASSGLMTWGFSVESVNYEFKDFESYADVDVPHYGFFMTHVVGNIYTWLNRWAFKLKSKRKK
ncbi:hypothetical protein [Pseudomonas sp. Marseille-Q0931]|uniref:hypothetical protein n=1 Tax=Pseudomonas sp. Marseille-Q0931 TaxID=2697507 RepID=UPI0023B91134|nr:hypothetical protein [Pseudomonas sp. Marseille-Q0931]